MYDLEEKTINNFVLNKLQTIDPIIYVNLIDMGKSDDFDFVMADGSLAVEITAIIDDNLRKLVQYEKALSLGKEPDRGKINAISYNEDFSIGKMPGCTLHEARNICINALIAKNKKLQRRMGKGQRYQQYVLCLCLYEIPFFENINEFAFINEYFDMTSFDKLYMWTSDRVYIYDKREANVILYKFIHHTESEPLEPRTLT